VLSLARCRSPGVSKVPGFVSSGLKRESMFKTPDAPEAKVGVVGSGQGMTDFDARKKFKMGSA
jgi:survival-of-motor-neuron-related-splicing factor 30